MLRYRACVYRHLYLNRIMKSKRNTGEIDGNNFLLELSQFARCILHPLIVRMENYIRNVFFDWFFWSSNSHKINGVFEAN